MKPNQSQVNDGTGYMICIKDKFVLNLDVAEKADRLYEAADALDAYCTTVDCFDGDVPDDVWIPFHKAMMEYEKCRRISQEPHEV